MSRSEQMRGVAGARGLGWASVGIGLTELFAPHLVAHGLGLKSTMQVRGVLRTLGLRELMHGASILTEDAPTPQLSAGVWSRVAGDALDNVLLGIAAKKTKRPGRFAVIAASVGVIGLLDVYYARQISKHHDN